MRQKLLTKEIIKKLEKRPFGSTDGQKDKKFVCKFFDPSSSATWLVAEGEKQENGDWLFFGKVHILETEWGYFTLSELQQPIMRNLRINGQIYRVPVSIERDQYYDGKDELKDD